MVKVDIISGFLGAGKTTLIKKLIKEAFAGSQIVLIENEFGEIGVDGGFLKEAGINITEMNSGCICCSLVGDFGTALKEVIEKYSPERIIIEPSGVGKLSDVEAAVMKIEGEVPEMDIATSVAVVDSTKAKIYMKNFGEFFNNQIESARIIVLSRTQKLTQEKLDMVVSMIREHNEKAPIITTPWDDITGEQILGAMEGADKLEQELMMAQKAMEHHHEHEHHHHEHEHHHHHDEEIHETDFSDASKQSPKESTTSWYPLGRVSVGSPDAAVGGSHDHEEHEHHHDHDHDHEHHHHDHEHHYDENGVCSCGHHHHDHDHDHDADEVFTSWGVETPHTFTKDALEDILNSLADEEKYGIILRSKGIVPAGDGKWLHFDMTPGETEVREGGADYTGRICVIGSELKEDNLKDLFGV